MLTGDNAEKNGSVRYVKISGHSANFNKWKLKTLALARRKNLGLYLKEDMSKDPNFEKGGTDVWDQLVLNLACVQFDLIKKRMRMYIRCGIYESTSMKFQMISPRVLWM